MLNKLTLILFISILLYPVIVRSTCIVILKVNGNIYIAADSKESFEGSSNYNTICKIHNYSKYYFAIGGHDDNAILANTLKSLKENNNIDNVISLIGAKMKSHYKKLMGNEKMTANSVYQYYLHNALGSVVFAYFLNNTPFIKEIEFRMDEIKGITTISYKLFSDTPFTVIGFHDHIDMLTNDQLSIMMQSHPNNPELFAENLVKLEMGKHPHEIGEPIDLLVIGTSGALWLTPTKCN